jgi:hypothetical protein
LIEFRVFKQVKQVIQANLIVDQSVDEYDENKEGAAV